MSVQNEKALGKRGYLLYDHNTQKHIFRVYESEDKRQFTDYRICAEDIQVEILDRFVCLYKGDDPKLDYARRLIGN